MTTIEDIAQLTAQRKLLPFLGAGCSKAMLNCDWDSLIRDMRSCICTAAEGHLAIAQAYVDEHGKAGLCEFLRPRLYSDHFDEEKGDSHIAVMCSGAHVIYTTNQDNVMELCMEHFGRKFCKVVQLDDCSGNSSISLADACRRPIWWHMLRMKHSSSSAKPITGR